MFKQRFSPSLVLVVLNLLSPKCGFTQVVTFEVNSTADTPDVDLVDGVCDDGI